MHDQIHLLLAKTESFITNYESFRAVFLGPYLQAVVRQREALRGALNKG